MNDKIVLYQMLISHYSEKVRWALDFKRIEHKKKNLLPGLHVPVIQKLTRNLPGKVLSSVPVITHGRVVIQGSSQILDYLDEHASMPSLMPKNDALSAEVREWEGLADSDIGPHVRCCCYHVLLEHPHLLIPLLSHDGPFYGSILLKIIYPKLKGTMRKAMKINQESFESSKFVLDGVMDKIRVQLTGRKYLVGDKFSRADLAVCALLAPLARPDGYGVHWPELPRDLDFFEKNYRDVLGWVREIYATYR